MPKSSKTSKQSKAAKPQPAATQEKPKSERLRVKVLGYSATSVLKWMGANGWTREDAVKAFQKLATGGEVKPSTIATGLSDGRSEKYRAGAAELSAAEQKQLKAAAK